MGGELLHTIPLHEVLKKFGTTKYGLTTEHAQERLSLHGYNVLTEKKDTSLFIRFLLQFKNFFSLLLLVGALLSFIGHFFSPGQNSDIVGFVLIGVTLLNAIFTFFQEYRAQQAMKSFRNLISPQVLLLRDHEQISIDTKYVVPGDVIILREGDKIPADARIIEEHMLKVDHSMLTGESEPQLRSTESSSDKELLTRNMVFSGTLVQSGSGKALVVRTGDETEIGKIAHLTTTVKSKESKIRAELNEFVGLISTIAIILGISFFGLGVIIGRTFWESIVFGIGIIVANVPEGLLPTVTLTLSLAGQKMAKDDALVKDIEAIETLGGVTVICTDKTGTLTENRLSTRYLYYNQTLHEYDAFHKTFYDPKEVHYLHAISDTYFDELLDTMYLCNNSVLREDGTSSGDPTEVALREVVATQKDTSIYESARREQEIPFDSEKKYMIVATDFHHERKAYLKGSPQVIVDKCTHFIRKGKKIKLTSSLKQELVKKNDEIASRGQRVLALATKPLANTVASEDYLEKNNYIFLGFIALQDPPRKEVAQAVKQCYDAGIKIIVISGDQERTVTAIAQQTGILASAKTPVIITSELLATMTDDDLEKELRKPFIIFSRSLPQDKLRVVSSLQRLGEIVAVTGDGVNDAPALKQADVGVAMGKSGTDVAKDAANMVLLDDNFATIVKAVKRGRTVFENIKKFVTYILTSNIPEILPFLFFVLLGWPLALPILLILAIDLGTDMLPAISLGVERSEVDVMKRPPRRPNTKLLTRSMLIRSYGVVGMIEPATAFLVFFIILYQGGWQFGDPLAVMDPLYMSAVSGFFASIIITQIFNLIACRSSRMPAFKRNPLKNRFFLLGIVVELLLLAIVILTPPGQYVFGTAPFDAWLFLVMIGGGVFIYALEEVRKYLYRTKGWFSVG